MYFKYTQKGFTLIELLVVITIIGLVSAIIVSNVLNIRNKVKIKKAAADLAIINIAMSKLAADTGKWPNGCPAGEWENPEVYLDDPMAGIVSIVSSPVVTPMGSGYTRNSCAWTATDISKWKGPYMKSIPTDPWGNRYMFDPDYCDENGKGVVAILSMGPDGAEEYKSSACGLGNYWNPNGPPPGDDIVVYPGSSVIP